MKLWDTLEPENVKKVLARIEEMIRKASKEKPLKIFAHADADGITSAVLLVAALKTEFIEVTIQSRFRTYEDADIGLDLGAPKEEFTGVAIDHHDHFTWENKYDLIWDSKPTARIVYDLFKDRIPDNQKWKVVVGIAGDGQAELIPDDIWDKYSSLLLTELETIEGESYGKYTHWEAPLYTMLSSPINAISKTGNTYEAYVILKKSDNPLDIIYHPMALAATKRIKDAMNRISRPREISDKLRIINFKRLPVAFCVVNLEESITSNIAYKLRAVHRHKTVIIVNSKTLSGSIRGDLAKYIANKLVAAGFDAGGHPAYCGITLKDSQDIPNLLGALGKICN
uniref:Putative DHH family protein n=1 Tax=viral metagenome TaxID=1070528 RepID=A0A6H1ZW34_9ZZZZ